MQTQSKTDNVDSNSINILADSCSSDYIAAMFLELSKKYEVDLYLKEGVSWHAFPKLLRKIEGWDKSRAKIEDNRGIINNLNKCTLDALKLIDISSYPVHNSHHKKEAYYFVVIEDQYVCPLYHPAVGWGSLRSRSKTAKVLVFRCEKLGQGTFLLGEGEIRTHPSCPAITARNLREVAIGLVSQGVLDRYSMQKLPIPQMRLPYDKPSYLAFISWLTSFVCTAARQRCHWRWQSHTHQWGIGLIRHDNINPFESFPWEDVDWQQPPSNGFVADPFLVQNGENMWIFFEELLYSEHKGRLLVAGVDSEKNTITEPRTVLEKNYHLSFPFVFTDDNNWYLLPEQSQSGTTMLYRSIEFPGSWSEYCELVPNFPGIDPVLFHYDGCWWLFVTFGNYSCHDNNLYIFFSKSIGGPYQHHPQNPVKSGLRGSRMAGSIYESNGRIVRLGQDCRFGYGNSIILFEIKTISVLAYDEQEINCWLPSKNGPFNVGIHSFSSTSELCAVDGLRYSTPGRSIL